MISSAELSPCRSYRYALWRDWSGLVPPTHKGYVMIIGLNPSTADETKDDATIRRCISFARSWGYSHLCMANLFAFRARHVKDMKAARDPVGPENDAYLHHLGQGASLVVAAWGTDGGYLQRDRAVRAMFDKLHYLRLTKDGYPSHPLYLPRNLSPIEWRFEP